jgi:hypothetical protein
MQPVVPVVQPLWTSLSADRSVFGRRFEVVDGSFLPASLPRLMLQRLMAIADDSIDIAQVQRGTLRDHFFYTVLGCGVMVRFSTAAVNLSASPGYTACSMDVAVSAPRDKHQQGAQVLDRVVLALCELLADASGPCKDLRLVKHAFAWHQPELDAGSCHSEPDEELRSLVWADRVVSVCQDRVAVLRQNLSDQAMLAFYEAWRQSSSSSSLLSLVDPVKSLRALLDSEHAVSLLTDPFWVSEVLPPGLPPSLTDTAGRFGWIPSDGQKKLTELPPGVFHQLNSATVVLYTLDNGRFGPSWRGAQDHLQQSLACRVVRRWQPFHRTAVDSVLHKLSSARYVVPLAQYCLVSVTGDLLVPLVRQPAGRAFEMTLLEALNELPAGDKEVNEAKSQNKK